MTYWYQKAREGSAVGTSLCVDLMKRRAAMVGTDSPSNLRVEVIGEATANQPSSTEALLRELDRIANEGKSASGGLAIEHDPDPPAS
jgi:hypothetical protein